MNKQTNKRWIGAVALTAAVTLPPATQAQDESTPAAGPEIENPHQYRNVGPYIGGALGYNEVDDQLFGFDGSSTAVSQPTVPVELPPTQHTGNAALNEYEGNVFGQAVVGYKWANGLRTEFEIGYRQNDTDGIIEFGNPNRLPVIGVNAEPGASQQTESTATNVKITTTTGLFNVWYDFFPSWRIHPYVGGGVGFARYKLNKQPTNRLSEGTAVPSTPGNTLPGPALCPAQDCFGPRKSDDGALAYQIGGGVRWDMRDDITVGLDYRYLKGEDGEFYGFRDQQETFLEADYEAQSVMLSVNYFFALPAPPAPPAPPPAILVSSICSDGLDNDGDGLIDFPADPGCSSPEDDDETDPPQCSDGKDNDGDGLIDFPADPGCTSADDNDETDPCKTPAVGERVSLKGCGLGDVIVLRGVNFEFDQARLTVNAKTILDNVAEELVAYPEITIELGGHTDAKGSDEYNQSLSERRAAAVVGYLEDKGVAADRMSSAGYGEAQPVADNETDEGRELNRRVELKITSGVAPGSTTTSDGSSSTLTEGVSTEPAVEAPAADAAAADAMLDEEAVGQ